MSKDDPKQISLKEAAKISGYSPDYLGQLIRKGKLPGSQVCCNVAWMTTEEAVKEYLTKNQNRKNGNTKEDIDTKVGLSGKFWSFRSNPFKQKAMARIFKIIIYSSIALSVIFFLLLFYIFSVSVEKKLQQNSLEKIEQKQKTNIDLDNVNPVE